jgi:aminoglycoside 6'-N-acetyltransferase I
MTLQPLTRVDAPGWLDLRRELWPEGTAQDHLDEMASQVAEPGRYAQFIARDAAGRPLGLAEAALRRDYVPGTDSSPVAFLEGLYVRAGARRRGIARRLVAAVAAWAGAQGCSELASDTPLDNDLSQAVHRRLGFEETERVVFFRLPLLPAANASAAAAAEAATAATTAAGAAAVPGTAADGLRAEIERFFDRYRSAFDALDGDAVAALYAEPAAIAQSGRVTVWPDRAAVAANMRALCAQYAERGWAGADFGLRELRPQGPDHTFADLRWTLRRTGTAAPWVFGTAYNLVRTGEGWRVALCIAYEEGALARIGPCPNP